MLHFCSTDETKQPSRFERHKRMALLKDSKVKNPLCLQLHHENDVRGAIRMMGF